MRPAKSPLRKALFRIATSIDRARRCGFDPDFQSGVRAAAEEIRNELVVPSEQDSFMVACGLSALDSTVKND